MSEEIFKVEDIVIDIKKLAKDIKNGDVNISEEFEKFIDDDLATARPITAPKLYTKKLDIDIDEWMDTFNRKGEEPTSEDFSNMLQYVHDHFVKSNLSNGVAEALSCIEFFNIRDREIIHKIIDNNYNIAVKRSLIDFDKNIYSVNVILMVPHAMSDINIGIINKNERSHDDVLNSINIIKNRFSSDEEDDKDINVLEDKSWKEIADAIKDGTFSSYASVGDTKSFTMNNKVYHAEVVSINDGSGEAGRWYPDRTVDFITKELYETTYSYNMNNTNHGGFPNSELHDNLNHKIYPLLPSDLKDVIIEKPHSYITSMEGDMGIDSTKLWLPTYYEIVGTAHTHAPGETSSNNKLYTLASTIKMLNGQTSANIWWLSSLFSSRLQYFWNIYSSGFLNYSNASGWFGVPICFRIGEEDNKDILDYYTWDEINNAIKDGTFSEFASVGDTKSFTMNGKTYHAEVVSINDGSGEAGKWYPNNTVDFITKELYETKYSYNTDNTNTGGFPSSALRGTLINTVYPLLPQDLKDVIIEKSHSYITSTGGAMGTDSTKLWLPTYYEITGATATYAPRETASNNKAYTLASKIKMINEESSAYVWWLGSLNSDGSTYFWGVLSSGNVGYSYASNSLGVPLCFRIGEEDKHINILENKSWEEINDAIKDGTFSNFASVGDTKLFVINNKVYHAEVVSINDGTGEAAQWYPNKTVDFITKELYATTCPYNLTNTNAGGFPNSELHDILNQTIYPLLPQDLKDVIVAKSHSYNTSMDGDMGIDSTKLWLPTHYEIAGAIDTDAPGENSSNNKAYTLTSKVKILNGGSVNYWWLGSLNSRYPTYFWRVFSPSFVNGMTASISDGVPICFRIGEESEEDKHINILENKSWKEIAEAIKDGTFSEFASVGDTKSFILNDKVYHAEVVSINDGNGEAGEWYPAKTVDFICEELYDTSYQYNSTDTNAGGFPNSALREILENTLYPLLPSDLRDVIIEKSHIYITSIGGAMLTDSTKLWLPTRYEIEGTTSDYGLCETTSDNKAYILGSKNKKRNGKASTCIWWLGSLFSGNSTHFWGVGSSGVVDCKYASGWFGVPICFRIGEGSEEDKDISILENKSWEEINNAIKDGTFSNFASVGDTKSFSINGKIYHAEVVSINDGSGEAGRWYPDRTVDFICVELYETRYPYNSTDTNVGGFPSSDLRGILETTLYPILPSDLKDVIVAKTHSYNTSMNGDMNIDSTKLWLPTHYEIAGTTDGYAPGETASNNKAYTLTSKVKVLNRGSLIYWWLGSLNSGNSTSFWCAFLPGDIKGNNASYTLGVPICFRIGHP